MISARRKEAAALGVQGIEKRRQGIRAQDGVIVQKEGMRTARLAQQKIPLSGKPPARQMAMPDESVTVRFEHPGDCLRLGQGATRAAGRL